MFSSRYERALSELDLDQVKASSHLVMYPKTFHDMSCIPSGNLQFCHDSAVIVSALSSAGFAEQTDTAQSSDMVYVHVPRAKGFAQHLIGLASRVAQDGLVFVDGAKNDGIDSLLKKIKARVEILGLVSRAHGKLFWFKSNDQFQDWIEVENASIADGFRTRVGLFSATHIDPASQLLAEHFPQNLTGDIADLGAGWGYLSAQLLKLPHIGHVDLVEVDRRALACARLNCAATRASFHWADVSTWKELKSYDVVVMNPPFHTDRKADPEIGRRFISKAASILKPKGVLYMVANRHLPYEAHLDQIFVKVSKIAETNSFKVLTASGPIR